MVATGATHGYFGHDDWAAYAPGLKSLDDATAIRRRLLLAFEQAEMAANPDLCTRLLTIVIVGGGPTGVEMAGAVAELARKALAADFREIDPRRTRVLLLEAGPRLLSAFPGGVVELHGLGAPAPGRRGAARPGGHALRARWRHGRYGADRSRHDHLGGGCQRVAGGEMAGHCRRSRGEGAGWSGPARAGHENIFVIGDTALALNPDGTPVPGIAPAAKQEGAHVARVLLARIEGREPPPRFIYADRGLLATIGRKAAVIAYKRVRLKGRFAWWLWGAAHIYFLVNLRNRIIVDDAVVVVLSRLRARGAVDHRTAPGIGCDPREECS